MKWGKEKAIYLTLVSEVIIDEAISYSLALKTFSFEVFADFVGNNFAE